MFVFYVGKHFFVCFGKFFLFVLEICEHFVENLRPQNVSPVFGLAENVDESLRFERFPRKEFVLLKWPQPGECGKLAFPPRFSRGENIG